MEQSSRVLLGTQLLVSAIIPTRGDPQFLGDCVTSILSQTYPDIEAVVVDEGRERSEQRNIGARRAAGAVLWSTDDDYIFDADLVQQAVDKISAGYDAVIVHGTSIADNWLSETKRRERECYLGSWSNEAACIFTREAFFAVGGFDESLDAFEDGDLQRRLDKAGFRTARIPAKAYHLGEPHRLAELVPKFQYYGRKKNVARFVSSSGWGPRVWSLVPVRLVHLRHMRVLGLWFFPMTLVRYVEGASVAIGLLKSFL